MPMNAAAEFERQFATAQDAKLMSKKMANAALRIENDALRIEQQFEQTTPMLVMPFGVFKAQGRIVKSTKVWRDKALAAGILVEHEEGSG